jgi:effector-binding domain-containing protein
MARSLGRAAFLALLATGAAAQQPPAPGAPLPPKPADDTQVLTTEAWHAVVLPMKGSYLQHQEAFGRLASYLAGRGIAPAGPPFGRYFSDPSVGEANLVWEVGFQIPADVTVEAPYELRDLPAALAAVKVHRGPIEELGSAWGAMIAWIMGNGYQVAGPAMQVFKGDMATSPEVEMRLPVQK